MLDEALKDVKYDNVFVIGSLSAFLFHNDKDLPSLLRTTHDIDLVQINNAFRGIELKEFIDKFGTGSEFEAKNEVHAEFVPANLFDCAIGWEDRMKVIDLPSGKQIQCLAPIDAAITKLTAPRSDEKDTVWIASALKVELFTQKDLENNLKAVAFKIPINVKKIGYLIKELEKRELKLELECKRHKILLLDETLQLFNLSGYVSITQQNKNRPITGATRPTQKLQRTRSYRHQ